MTREHPTAQHVTHGMPDFALAVLDARTKALVVKLMARVAERAYRRGAQQGAHIALTRPKDLPRSLADWRFRPSTDLSPWLDRRIVKPSSERLFMENPGLRRLGLPDPEFDRPATPAAAAPSPPRRLPAPGAPTRSMGRQATDQRRPHRRSGHENTR